MAVRAGDAAPGTLPNLLTCDEEQAAPPTGGFRLRTPTSPSRLDQYLAQLVPDMLDRNNKQIADRIMRWIDSQKSR